MDREKLRDMTVILAPALSSALWWEGSKALFVAASTADGTRSIGLFGLALTVVVGGAFMLFSPNRNQE